MKLTTYEKKIKLAEKKIIDNHHKHSTTDIATIYKKVEALKKKAENDQEAWVEWISVSGMQDIAIQGTDREGYSRDKVQEV